MSCWVSCYEFCKTKKQCSRGKGIDTKLCTYYSLCARSACTRPILAGVCGVCVCVCVFGLMIWLRPATPGWFVGACVCFSARSSCTPPIPAGVCGVGGCAWARASAVPRHSWLGCVCVCVFVCALILNPAYPGSVCGVDVCAWALALAAPRHCWLRCWSVFVFVRALCLYRANPGPGARCGCRCLGSVFGCAPPLLVCLLGCVCRCAPSACTAPFLAGVLGCVCVCVRPPPVPRLSWLRCAVWVFVPLLRFRLHPAIPGWCVCVFVCLCAPYSSTPPILAGVCGVAVCAWAPVSAAPRNSWLGCWGVCVCLCARSSCTLPFLAGCAVWVCVLRPGLGCTPPLLAGLLGCVCRCAHSACTPALLAGVSGV